MKRKLWTTNFRPFIFGGDVHAPIMTEYEASELVDVGKGYKAFMVISPSGKTFVCESETGAIVGSTFENVKSDIENGNVEDMKEQIKHAKELVKKAYMASPEEMWERLRAESQEPS